MNYKYLLLTIVLSSFLMSCAIVDSSEVSSLQVVSAVDTIESKEEVKQNKTVRVTDGFNEVPDPSEVSEEILKANPFIVCAHYYGVMTPPPPPLTGIEREEPIVLMTRKEFNERIQLSPLWESLYDKKLRNGSYGPRYSFLTLGKLIGSSNYLNVDSLLDGYKWQESQRITEISYGNYGVEQRSKYQHQLLDQERVEMIETLKLAIDGIDDETAAKIIDDLYKQYMVKVNNTEYLSDGQTIHTFLEYEGKFIALWGRDIDGYKLSQCNYKLLEKLTIH